MKQQLEFIHSIIFYTFSTSSSLLDSYGFDTERNPGTEEAFGFPNESPQSENRGVTRADSNTLLQTRTLP